MKTKKRQTIYTASLQVVDKKVTERSRKVVEKLIAKHHDITEIARLIGTSVHTLMDGSKEVMTRAELVALQRHYNVSLLWLWTGLGPQFLPEGQPDLTVLPAGTMIIRK